MFNRPAVHFFASLIILFFSVLAAHTGFADTAPQRSTVWDSVEKCFYTKASLEPVQLKILRHTYQSSNNLNCSIGQIDINHFPDVNVYVSVTDIDGNPINGIGLNNFDVWEDVADGNGLVSQAFSIKKITGTSFAVTVILVMDRSGSMSNVMDDVKTAANNFISQFSADDACGIISFATNVSEDIPITKTDNSGKQQLISSINALSSGGSTSFNDAVYEALEMLSGSGGARTVIAFTDGDDNDSTHTANGAITYANQLGIPVHTIGMGTLKEDVLQQYAEQTGGTYSGGSAAELEILFQQIKQYIQAQYILTFHSATPELTDKTRSVKVAVDYSGNTASATATYSTPPPATVLGNISSILSGFSNDPVNTGTGNFIHHQTDIRLRTRGIPLSFERFYNSQDQTTGALGRGWTHNYNIALTENDGEADHISIRWADGRKDYWLADQNLYTPINPGNRATLTKTSGIWTCAQTNLMNYQFYEDGRLYKIVDRNSNELTLTYDAAPNENRLLAVQHTTGQALHFAYDVNGYLAAITEALNDGSWVDRTVQFSMTNNHLSSVTDLSGHAILYGYDGNGYLASVTDQRGIVIVANTYDAEGRVLSQLDGNNNLTDFSYDTPGENQTTVTQYFVEEGSRQPVRTIHTHDGLVRLAQITYPNSETIEFSYTGNNNRDSIIDRNGNARSFKYDADGNVTSVTSPDGTEITFQYNEQHQPVRGIDAEGNEIEFEYDVNGNLLLERRWLDFEKSDAAIRSYTYNANGQIETATDERGNTTQFIYNASGHLTEIIDPLGDHTWFAYDAAGRRTHVTGPRGSGDGDPDYTTTFTYDASDRLLEIHSPAGIVAFTYDAAGDRLSSTNPRGFTTDYIYDDNGAPIRIARPLDSTTTYAYDSLNRQIETSQTSSAGKQVTKYTYDLLGNVISGKKNVEGILPYESTFTYDAQGNTLSATTPFGVTVRADYDNMNRRTRVRDAYGHQYQTLYNRLGQVAGGLDPNGNFTQYHYDALRRLSSVNEPAPDGGKTSYTYDKAGNLTEINNARGIVIMRREFDALNRLIREEDADGRAFVYTYDAAGNLDSVTNPNGQTNTLYYDTANRLIRIDYADGTQVAYVHDENGNITQMTGPQPGTTVTLAYDELDRLVSSTGAHGKTVQYQYDAAGNRTRLTYPDGKTVNYKYDKANRVTEITDWAGRKTTFVYTGEKRIAMTYPNGVTVKYSYDKAGRLDLLEYRKADNTLIFSQSFTRDGVGNPTHIDEQGLPDPALDPTDIDYQYDNDNRITTETDPAEIISYTHDANGNLTGVNYPVAGKTVTYAYDAANRLIGRTIDIGLADQYSETHMYDAMGNRHTKAIDDFGTLKNKYYVLDYSRSMSHVLCELDESKDIQTYYIHGSRIVDSIQADGTQRYFITDAIGSVVALTDENGNVTDRYTYAPYGEIVAREGSSENPFTFVGGLGVMDEGDGVYFMRARFYDSGAGRFLNKDTDYLRIYNVSTLNRYMYCRSQPIMYVDPSGKLFGLDDLIVAGIGAAGGVVGTLVNDVVTGERHTWEEYAGAAAGGAAGAVVGYNVTALTLNPAIGGAAGGAVSSGVNELTTHALWEAPTLWGEESNATRDFSWEDFATKVAVGAGTGAVFGGLSPSANGVKEMVRGRNMIMSSSINMVKADVKKAIWNNVGGWSAFAWSSFTTFSNNRLDQASETIGFTPFLEHIFVIQAKMVTCNLH